MNNNAKVLGIKKLNFTNDSGEVINGYQVWVQIYAGEPEWKDGIAVIKVWCAHGTDDYDKAAALKVDQELPFMISIKGKVRFVW